MHVKDKYLAAISDAIDFISCNVDGASEEHNERETLEILNEIHRKMRESRSNKLVSYYVRKELLEQTKRS